MPEREHAEADRVAQNLVREVGEHATTIAAVKAEDCREAVDPDGVRHWLEVARRINAILASAAPPSFAWRLMQRIELYRHRAMEAERRAANSPEELRQDLIQIAAHWRDLGLQAQLLAESVDTAAPAAAEEPRRRRQGSA